MRLKSMLSMAINLGILIQNDYLWEKYPIMKPCLFALSLMLTVSCSSFEPFTFVQLSDTQIGFIDTSPRYAHSDSLMQAAVAGANALKPAYVFVTGDLVNDSTDPVQDSVYRACLARIEAPVYAVPGNHDYKGGFTLEKREAYLAQRGYDRFSFRDRDCAFIGMDSNCIKDGVKEAEDQQWEWLVRELDAAKGCKYRFVFLHCPIVRERMDEPEDYFNFSMEQRRKYVSLFKEKGVDVVFAGHTHQDYDALIDGIRFVAAGPVGNALGHGTPGYHVVSVGESGVDITYTPTPGVDPKHCVFQ